MNIKAKVKSSCVFLKYINTCSRRLTKEEIIEYTENRIEDAVLNAYNQGKKDATKTILKRIKTI